ncbi:MAG: hypothetical protein CMJ98_03365 [Planctomycetes bacterium]|jgi:predicted GIY-YIG superfamily endonuclease|nr:hypothetical protein [Planctomycetota bacterium]MBV20906.1 hypothetical protein [Planctomycetaceae bacterium]HJM56594.1 GIY-YIG nuclease family protein [Planctomycetota bacterium]
MSWTVYVLLSESHGVTYVGISTDVERRLLQHNGEVPGGARSTTRGRPWELAVTYGPYPDRGRAQAVEYQVKRRRGKQRLDWVEDEEP